MTPGPGVASEPTSATLKQQLDTAISDRDELQAQQVALIEVLQAIKDSPGDLVYRLQFLGHRVEPYAALATG